MKFNWLVRIKNPNFWIGLMGMLMCAMHVEASMFTSWQIVIDRLVELIKNPFMVGSVLVALWGYVQDFTTKGTGDTDLAMTYTEPCRCADTVEDEDDAAEEEVAAAETFAATDVEAIYDNIINRINNISGTIKVRDIIEAETTLSNTGFTTITASETIGAATTEADEAIESTAAIFDAEISADEESGVK